MTHKMQARILFSLWSGGRGREFPGERIGAFAAGKRPAGGKFPDTPAKRALAYGIILSITEPPERSGFIPAVCVRFTPPRLHSDITGRIVKSANQPSGINPARSSSRSFLIYIAYQSSRYTGTSFLHALFSSCLSGV